MYLFPTYRLPITIFYAFLSSLLSIKKHSLDSLGFLHKSPAHFAISFFKRLLSRSIYSLSLSKSAVDYWHRLKDITRISFHFIYVFGSKPLSISDRLTSLFVWVIVANHFLALSLILCLQAAACIHPTWLSCSTGTLYLFIHLLSFLHLLFPGVSTIFFLARGRLF